MGYALEVENLGKVYGKKVVLFNFSLKVKKGSIFGLLGPNGAGKSTFIRIVSGLEEQDAIGVAADSRIILISVIG